jgi:hypothetical protein
MDTKSSVHLDVIGVRIALESSLSSVLECVADTYWSFGAPPSLDEGSLVLGLDPIADGFRLRDSRGVTQGFKDEHSALLGTLERITQIVLGQLTAAGILAVHAAAAVHRGETIIMAGRSGSGKTTLVLGLLSRGLTLLSDELALIAKGDGMVLPYPRSIHVRPGTPELIPALAYLSSKPPRHLGGGIKWSVNSAALDRAIPGCMAGPAPARHILLLEPPAPGHRVAELVPIAPAVTVVELLRGAPAVAFGLGPVVRRLSEVVANCRCARLTPGPLAGSLDLVTQWLEQSDR